MQHLKIADEDEIAVIEASGIPEQVHLLVEAYNNAGRVIFPDRWQARQPPAIVLVRAEEGGLADVKVAKHRDNELEAFINAASTNLDGPIPPITRATPDEPLLTKGTPEYVRRLEKLLMDTAFRMATFLEEDFDAELQS